MQMTLRECHTYPLKKRAVPLPAQLFSLTVLPWAWPVFSIFSALFLRSGGYVRG